VAVDYSGKVVYAMQVTKKLTMEEYDACTIRLLLGKVPDWTHHDRRRRLGDSIYDLPTYLRPIIKQGQGHRADSNASFVRRFVDWWQGLNYEIGAIVGNPQWNPFGEKRSIRTCALGRFEEAENDERLEARLVP
jgi:hypothetical protein